MLNFTVIKLSISLLIGIVLEFYFKIPVAILLPIGFFLFILFGILYFRSRRLIFPDLLFGISFLLIALFLGIFNAAIRIPENQPTHFTHQINIKYEGVFTLIAEVTEKLKPTERFDRYIISAKNLQGKQAEGKVLLNFKKDSTYMPPEIGDLIMLPAKFLDIEAPLNPHQFNYKEYLARAGILNQIYSQPDHIQVLGNKAYNLHRIAESSREKIIKKLEEANFSKNEFAIIKALLLGERRDISPTIYSNYAAAGAIHILAISGLHIGIILWLLSFLLKPLERIKYGKAYRFILILIFLWTFALITGLAPSVVRAVFMFFIIALGMQIRRKTNVTNSLFISLFFLLLINPYFIYQVGFQLSYLAMFGIVCFQPLLQNLWKPNSRFVLYFWKLLTVSLAAQIAVLPLSLYYFHQFPGLFFITNLVILPFLGLILGVGLLLIVLSLLDFLPHVFIVVYEWIILQMNNFVSFIASFHGFVIKEITFPLLICISLYLLLFSIHLFWKKYSVSNLLIILCSVVIFQMSLIYEKTNIELDKAIVFQVPRQSTIGVKKHQTLRLYSSSKSQNANQPILSNFISEENIETRENLKLKNVLEIFGRNILVIDSSGIYELKSYKPDIVLLTNSPKININRMIEELEPKVVIADGSNYKYMTQFWTKTIKTENSLFYNTAEKGAFIIYSSAKTLK